MIYDRFEEELKKLIAGDKQVASRPLAIGRPSNILSKCGADISHDITITKKVINKAMRPELRDDEGRLVGNTGHGLSADMLLQALKELDSPALIFSGKKKDSILIITNVKDSKERNVVVAIEFNRIESFTQVSSVRSVYGRDNLERFIGNNITDGNLIAANKEKADEMLRSIGKSYPEENTFINFN